MVIVKISQKRFQKQPWIQSTNKSAGYIHANRGVPRSAGALKKKQVWRPQRNWQLALWIWQDRKDAYCLQTRLLGTADLKLQQPSSVYWQSSWKQPNVGSALNTLQIYLLRLICFSNSVSDKLLNTRGHCAAVTTSLVFQKWLNDLLLQQLWQVKATMKFYNA